MFMLREHHMAALSRSYSAAQLAQIFKPFSQEVTYEEGDAVILLKDPKGDLFHIELDRRGRIAETVSATGQTQQFAYTQENRISYHANSQGLQVAFTWDAAGRLTSLTEDLHRRWLLAWDDFGNLTRIVDPAGASSEMLWYGPGLLHAYRDRTGGAIVLGRDELARILSLQDPNGRTTRYEYSRFDRPDRIRRPDGSTEEIVRDGMGRIIEALRNGKSLAKASWTVAGKLESLLYADGHFVAFEYDGKGRTTKARNSATAIARSWDDDGHLLEEAQAGQVVACAYDVCGSLASLKLPGGEEASFSYDRDGRIQTVQDWTGETHRIEFSSDSRTVTHRYASGVTREERWSSTGRLEAVGITLPGISGVAFWSRTEYDANLKVAAIHRSDDGVRKMRYDPEGRLTGVYGSQFKEQYVYDFNGNRASCACNSMDQVISDGFSHMTYDDAGNMISSQGPRGLHRFHYNGQNLLTSADLPNGGRVEYEYDAFARRISKRVGAVVTRYLWAGDQLVREWTLGPEIDSSCDYLFLPGTHTPYAMRRDGRVYHFHNDHLGSPQWLTDSQGQVVWSGAFNAFGEASHIAGTISQPFRFPGHYFDEETGLHYNRARYYSPSLGRYLSRDPLEILGGTNFYVYANSDPFNQTDPLGLLSGWAKIAVAGAFIAVGVTALIVAAPAIAAVIAGAAVTTAVISAAGLIVAGGAAIGGGISLALAPDGCVECQSKAFWSGAEMGAGLAIAFLGIVLGPVAGGPALALAGGGEIAGGAALTQAAVVVGGLLMAGHGASNSGGNSGDGSSSSTKRTSQNQMQKQVEKGQAPKSVDRVDKGVGPNEQDHIHFDDGSALNDDGTWKHGGRPLTNSEKNWVTDNGWNPPK